MKGNKVYWGRDFSPTSSMLGLRAPRVMGALVTVLSPSLLEVWVGWVVWAVVRAPERLLEGLVPW